MPQVTNAVAIPAKTIVKTATAIDDERTPPARAPLNPDATPKQRRQQLDQLSFSRQPSMLRSTSAQPLRQSTRASTDHKRTASSTSWKDAVTTFFGFDTRSRSTSGSSESSALVSDCSDDDPPPTPLVLSRHYVRSVKCEYSSGSPQERICRLSVAAIKRLVETPATSPIDGIDGSSLQRPLKSPVFPTVIYPRGETKHAFITVLYADGHTSTLSIEPSTTPQQIVARIASYARSL